ncbi:MAG: hypothetical protein HQK64_02525 [Desulfamplus sp.]|nr:hypothetical protein [Desulfamplus sp.]MBF0210036.1 hypothetical protein [Desulfamplus sp.]MBF0241337.1 hypothetical protein [Desulfamplus sp.]MBF0389324.1 hypothetical protein [Desulfamplus sp.]
MPTLEERGAETQAELKKRLKSRAKELGINCAFAEYIEMMEKYLLTLERRVKRIERRHNYNSDDLLSMEGEEIR